jgi:hypothetical protein
MPQAGITLRLVELPMHVPAEHSVTHSGRILDSDTQTASNTQTIVRTVSKPILLVSNNAAIGLKVVYCLKAAGHEVDVLATQASNATRFCRYVRRFEALPVSAGGLDAAAVERFVVARSDQRQWAAIVADDLGAHGLLHQAAPRLQVPAFAPWDSHRLAELHNKWCFYQRLENAGIPAPKSWLLNSSDDLGPAMLETLQFPLLVKPLNGESGHGIVRFDGIEDLRRYLIAPGPYKQLPLKLQRLIVGSTLGVSLLALDGKIHSHDVQLHAADGSRLGVAEQFISAPLQIFLVEPGFAI